MSQKTIVIHHSADFDGLFCREIARKFLPDAKIVGWDHGQPLVPCAEFDCIYILDLSPECVSAHEARNRVVWIDHHKSSIEKFDPVIAGYRIDGVAACRLAWQWFANIPNSNPPGILYAKQDFVNRTVTEPLAVRLAGEYDIWDRRDPRAELFQHGLRSQELSENLWDLLLTGPYPETDGKQGIGEITVDALLERGEAVQFAKTAENADIITNYGFDFDFEGLKFLACNHARFNSHLFTAGLKPEHDACFGFKWTGTDWSVSLYHAPGKEHHDLSLIAVKHGGGGHRGACGFRAETLPFFP